MRGRAGADCASQCPRESYRMTPWSYTRGTGSSTSAATRRGHFDPHCRSSMAAMEIPATDDDCEAGWQWLR